MLPIYCWSFCKKPFVSILYSFWRVSIWSMKIVIFQGEAICSAEVLAGFGRGSGRVRQGFWLVLAGFDPRLVVFFFRKNQKPWFLLKKPKKKTGFYRFFLVFMGFFGLNDIEQWYRTYNTLKHAQWAILFMIFIFFIEIYV